MIAFFLICKYYLLLLAVADPGDFEGGCGGWYENRVSMSKNLRQKSD